MNLPQPTSPGDAAELSAQQVETASEPFRRLVDEVGKTVVGQHQLIRRMLTALLAGGHLLIEGVPGLAKTTAVSCLASAISTDFQRLQFTPDLLPADLIGTQVYRPQDQQFVVQKGPIFSNLILADEINRAPAKETGHDWQRNIPACRTVSCHGNSESGGTRRHLSAARGTAGSFFNESRRRLSQSR